MMRSKCGNRKCVVNGIEFDSRKEARRYGVLKLLEENGVIYNLRRQVKFELIPAQYAPSDAVYVKGEKKGQQKPGKLLEKECAYYADFVYEQGGKTVVEDVKGYRNTSAAVYGKYAIKRKLMLYRYGIRVVEV